MCWLPDHLIWMKKPHMMEGENRLLQNYPLNFTCMHVHKHVHTIKMCSSFKSHTEQGQ